MRVIDSISEMWKIAQVSKQPLGFVPTMGAFHKGHMKLIEKAREDNATLAVGLFVNPSQFAVNEDFYDYPKDTERDLELLSKKNIDIVFAPLSSEIYPDGFNTWVDMGGMGTRLEGKYRPGHLRGVATVVLKLLNIVQPRRIYFGQKDGQQVIIVKKMINDFNFDVEIVVIPTVRESNGLAFSSRNVHLTSDQRQAASVIYRSLNRAKELWKNGVNDGSKIRREIKQLLKTPNL